MRLTAAAMAIAVTCATPQLLDSFESRPESREAERFLIDLRRAVAGRDKAAVARLVRYPITVTVSGIPPVPVRSAAAMVEFYDAFFGQELRCVIADSGLPNRTPRPRQPV